MGKILHYVQEDNWTNHYCFYIVQALFKKQIADTDIIKNIY